MSGERSTVHVHVMKLLGFRFGSVEMMCFSFCLTHRALLFWYSFLYTRCLYTWYHLFEIRSRFIQGSCCERGRRSGEVMRRQDRGCAGLFPLPRANVVCTMLTD